MNNSNEPKCCCCGVRTGLSILYVLLIIGAIINLISGSTSIPADALSIVQGLLLLACGIMGFASIANPSVKNASRAMYAYAAIEALFVILGVVRIAMAGPVVDALPKPDGSNLTDEEFNKVKAATKSAIITGGAIGIAISVIVVGAILERMYLYKKWLAQDAVTKAEES